MSGSIRNYLQVDELHRLYYEVHGNALGATILFVHGGPGIGCSEKDLQFFNLNEVNVILFDQRGCGNSTPHRELRQNTTNDLLEDILQLLRHLNRNRVFLFGGSWGSALSLLFGLKYPDKVQGMILRGVFTGAKVEREYLEKGGTINAFPKAWQRFVSKVPIKYHKAPSVYYFKKILEGTDTERDTFAYELAWYAASVSSFGKPEHELALVLRESDYVTRGLILSHYSIHDFFVPDRYILDNVEQLTDMPIHIIHGVNDHITLPRYAQALSEKLNEGKLFLVDGGHSPYDKEVKAQLIRSVNQITAIPDVKRRED